jgi:hypothetical protein
MDGIVCARLMQIEPETDANSIAEVTRPDEAADRALRLSPLIDRLHQPINASLGWDWMVIGDPTPPRKRFVARANPTRRQRAVSIRDMVLPLMRRYGRFSEGEIRWNTGDWTFWHRTPFSDWPGSRPIARNYLEAMILQHVPPVLPYGLDVWRGNKVMSCEWSDEQFRLISFRSGAWEEDLELFSRSFSPTGGV